MPNLKFQIALAQDAPVFMDVGASIAKACELAEEAAARGAKLLVFPEAFIAAYPDWVWLLPASKKAEIDELFSALLANSVSIPDEWTNQLCRAAKKAEIYLVIGVNERNSEASNSSIYNTMLYISPEGEILGKHRKLMPTGGERLMWSQGSGDTLVSFDTEVGKLGGLLCWENFMPLARQSMYNQGVQIYAAPTWDSSESWITAMRHIAREGGTYVVSCCQAIRIDDIPDRYDFKTSYLNEREWINKGNSCIVDPKGKFIAGPLSAEKGILIADIDLSEITAQKWLFDAAGHYARPDVFDFKIKL